MGARNSEINIPAAQTPPSQVYAAHIKPAKGFALCLAPWPWRVRCALRCCSSSWCCYAGSSSDRRRVGNTIPHYRHPSDKQTTERLHVPLVLVLLLVLLLLLLLPPLHTACPMLPVAAYLAAVLGLRSASHSPSSSHRTPSPSVRPVTRERSPKRVVRVRVWVVVAEPGPPVPGQHSILPSFDPPSAHKPALVCPPGSWLAACNSFPRDQRFRARHALGRPRSDDRRPCNPLMSTSKPSNP